MLDANDRDFLLEVARLAEKRPATLKKAVAKADAALAKELHDIQRLGAPAEREFALKIAALPLPADYATSIAKAGEVLAAEIDVLMKESKPAAREAHAA